MVIYLDLIFFINFFYDFLLMLTVSFILKRKRKIIYHLLSALVGSLSIFLLFLNINEIIIFILKIITSLIMCLISFKYINFKYTLNNMIYLYMCSIILAGFLYFLNITFSYDHIGIVFFNKYSINYILLIIIAPIILYLYYKSSKSLKNKYNDYYNISIYFDDIEIKCLAFFDNGNSLKDPISKKGVILLNNKRLNNIYNIRDPIYVPCNTISGSSLIKCYKPSYIVINNKKIYNYLIGEVSYKFSDGIECLLNSKLKEDNYV